MNMLPRSADDIKNRSTLRNLQEKNDSRMTTRCGKRKYCEKVNTLQFEKHLFERFIQRQVPAMKYGAETWSLTEDRGIDWQDVQR